MVPGLLIYTVSYQFVSRSIESWFDVKVEGALDAGLNLGRSTLDAQVADLAAKTRLAAERLADSQADVQPVALERLREQLSASEVTIVGSAGQTLLGVGGSARLAPDRPAAALLRQARMTPVASQLEGLDEEAANGSGQPAAAPAGGPARIRAIALIPKINFSLGEHDRFLLVTQLVAPALATNALAVQAAYREYQQRALARDGLRRMYIGTLTLALILAVFGALLLAVALGNQLARPLLVLADGVRQVAQGDLRPKPCLRLARRARRPDALVRRDDRASCRTRARRSSAAWRELESARANLQTILDNLTRRRDRVRRRRPHRHRQPRRHAHPAAAAVGLPRPPARRGGRAASRSPTLVRQRFESQAASLDAGERDQWQDAFEVRTAPRRATS